jgi:hypothetical protein
MDDAFRFGYPRSFEWGTYQPGGWRTFLLTALAYAVCVGVSVLLVRYVHKRGRPVLASVAGVVSLIPMSALAAQSVLVQLTAAAHQGVIHATAATVIGAALVTVVGTGVFAGMAARPPS